MTTIGVGTRYIANKSSQFVLNSCFRESNPIIPITIDTWLCIDSSIYLTEPQIDTYYVRFINLGKNGNQDMCDLYQRLTDAIAIQDYECVVTNTYFENNPLHITSIVIFHQDQYMPLGHKQIYTDSSALVHIFYTKLCTSFVHSWLPTKVGYVRQPRKSTICLRRIVKTTRYEKDDVPHIMVDNSCKAEGESWIPKKKMEESSRRIGRYDGDINEARFLWEARLWFGYRISEP